MARVIAHTLGVNAVAAAVEGLTGLPCWQPKRTPGSMFMVEFGEPQLEVSEPRMFSTEHRTRWTLFQPDGFCLQILDNATFAVHRADDPDRDDFEWHQLLAT